MPLNDARKCSCCIYISLIGQFWYVARTGTTTNLFDIRYNLLSSSSVSSPFPLFSLPIKVFMSVTPLSSLWPSVYFVLPINKLSILQQNYLLISFFLRQRWLDVTVICHTVRVRPLDSTFFYDWNFFRCRQTFPFYLSCTFFGFYARFAQDAVLCLYVYAVNRDPNAK